MNFDANFETLPYLFLVTCVIVNLLITFKLGYMMGYAKARSCSLPLIEADKEASPVEMIEGIATKKMKV